MPRASQKSVTAVSFPCRARRRRPAHPRRHASAAAGQPPRCRCGPPRLLARPVHWELRRPSV